MNNLNPFSLENKNILVTGASSGIGKAVAIACARMGASVVLNGRNIVRLQETLQAMHSGNHIVAPADILDSSSLNGLVNAMPSLDGIVHCAGVANRVPCKNITQSDIDFVMRTNMDAPMLLQASLLSSKKVSKGASIVFIASRAAESPSMGNAIYSASKGALISYAKCLALELAPRLIRVNCICPGMVWTELITKVLDEETLREAEQKYPLKRFGRVEDIANLAVYLLSNASTWMTGESINISGGGEGVLV
jgi:NAD(P)-dependent dehydrogenase (short-subunit alcohol dehydrogenase family)